jgi:cation diffusion facilitator CzcD-associated flavoprotein CzcO
MSEESFDVAVVGAGFGGVYAAYSLRNFGMSVIGLDGAGGFGGVWYHNGYPGARVDTDNVDLYSYMFSQELYDGWKWKERYACQPELMEYLNWAADKLDVRKLFRFDNWLRETKWSDNDQRWHLKTDRGVQLSCKYVVMCTGNLSEPKPIVWPGLDRFKGEWYRSNRWPHREIRYRDKKVAVIGTGSSGCQIVPVVCAEANHTYVFQRSPHYGVPAHNGPINLKKYREIQNNLADFKQMMLGAALVHPDQVDRKLASEYTLEEQQARMEKQYALGGHGMSYVFADIGTSFDANKIASDFVKNKIRQRVKDPALAEKLLPTYPIGTLRLVLETDYYECFNRDDVTLVDMKEDPIVEITDTGIRTKNNHYEVDTIIFALGFKPFLGAIDSAGVVNEKGATPRQAWARGPRTVFGLMTPGFPNLFHPTNGGSPSVLGPLILGNEFHVDWIVNCFKHMKQSGHTVIEATEEGAEIWGGKCAAVAENLIRRQVNNYMTHVNEDGTAYSYPGELAPERTYLKSWP